MKKTFIFLLALALALSLGLMMATPVAADPGTTYYVSTIGSDEGDGSWHDPWKTIQHAIGQVVSGDTIEVAPGTYVEVGQIVISKDLTIIGGDKETTIIKPAQNTGSSGDARGWFLVNVGKEFNLSNVTLDGEGKNVHQAIRSFGSGTVDNNIIKNIRYSQYNGLGVVVMGDDNMTISNNTLTNIERIGIMAYGSGVTDAQIIGNTYTGKGEGDWLDYGIEIGGGAKATITGNNFSSCGPSTTAWESAGILVTDLYGPGTEATITGSTLTNNAMGIAVGYDDTDLSVATISGNTLENNRYQVDCTSSVDVDLEATLANNTFDRAVVVRGSGIKVPTIFSSIQDAIDAASPGDTIIVSAGTYTEDLTVNIADLTIKSVNGESVTIQLVDGVGIDIQGGASGFTLGGALGEGFTILGGGGTTFNIQVVNAPSDVEISYNTIDATGSASMGISVGAAGATGLTVSNNSFIEAETGDGSIWGPDVVDVTVSGNTFTGPGSTTSGYAIQFAGVTGTSAISGNTISGYGSGVFPHTIGGATGISGLTISNNNISGCAKGIRLGHSSGSKTIASVTVTGNTLTNNTVQVEEPRTTALNMTTVLANNTFDRAVTVDHPGASLLHTIWSKIQDGIDAAVGGDTINVAAGTYDEQVVIDKSLTLQGAGDSTIIQPSATAVQNMNTYTYFSKDFAPVVYAEGTSSVTIQEVKIDGSQAVTFPSGTDNYVGLFLVGTDATVDHVTSVNFLNYPGSILGYNMYVNANSETVSVEIDTCSISGVGRGGIQCVGDGLTMNIHNCTVTGPGVRHSGELIANGILIWDSATGTIVNNTVSDFAYDGTGWCAQGIDGTGATSVTGNTVTDCQCGIGVWGDSSSTNPYVTISDNTITATGLVGSEGDGVTGITVDAWGGGTATATISNNNLSGGGPDDGIRIGQDFDDPDAIDATISSNTIIDWDTGIFIGDSADEIDVADNEISSSTMGSKGIYIPSTTTVTCVTINFNNIAGNDAYGLDNDASGTVDATRNWWGNASGPYNATTNPSGTGNDVSDNVDYSPWWGANYIGVGHPWDWYTNDSIQDAIDAASAGDTVNVMAGTYVEDLVIPAGKDGLELKGTGCNLTIIKGVATSAGTPVYNIRFDEFDGVSGVKIHGFTIESPDVPTNHFASGMVLNGQDIEIYDNCFVSKGEEGAEDNYCVAIQTWRWSAAPDSDLTGLKIYNNTFSSEGDLWVYQGVFVNRDGEDFGDVTVSGNNFSGNVHMGIAYEGNNAVISDNEMTSTYEGVGIAIMDWEELEQDDVEVDGNELQGFDDGVLVGRGAQVMTNITVANNVFSDNRYQVRDRVDTLNMEDVLAGNTFDRAVVVRGSGIKVPTIFSSIQDAIDAAVAGDTVDVGVGTYTGFEVTEDNLTIQGPTNAVVAGAAPGRDAVVYIGSGASNITMIGLTIDANGVTSGIQATEPGTYSSITILGSTINDFEKSGIVVQYASAVQLEDNIISTTDHSQAPNGIQIGFIGATTGTTGTIKDNQISGCHWDGYDPETETYEDDWTGSGILVIDTSSALDISDNEVHSCDVGMDIESGTPTTITGNDVHDNSYGFVLWNAAATINYNTVHENALYGVYCALGGSFSDVDATANWWGALTGPYHEELNPDGEGDNVSDHVLFEPWYGDEGMTTLVGHSTYEFVYDVPDVVVALEETDIPVTFQTDELGAVGYYGVRFKFDATGPGNVIFKATDSEGEHTFVDEGFWGPLAGFNLTADYSATTDWSLNFSEPGEYNITFSLIEAPDGDVVAGIEDSEDVTVRAVDILDHYRYLHEPYDEVTTLDLLAAADDWIANEVPPGFSEPITTMQLLALADEWYAS